MAGYGRGVFGCGEIGGVGKWMEFFRKASRDRGIEALREGSREVEKIKEKRKHPQVTQITQIF